MFLYAYLRHVLELGTLQLKVLFKMGHVRPLFLFAFSTNSKQMFNKIGRSIDSNPGRPSCQILIKGSLVLATYFSIFIKNRAIPILFFVIFVFSNKHYNFYRKKYNIRCWDSNPPPSEHEAPSIQNLPFKFHFELSKVSTNLIMVAKRNVKWEML